MGIDDMMYPGRPIPAELIERYGPMPVTRAADRRREYITARQAALHDPGATRYAHDLPRSPYYRGAI